MSDSRNKRLIDRLANEGLLEGEDLANARRYDASVYQGTDRLMGIYKPLVRKHGDLKIQLGCRYRRHAFRELEGVPLRHMTAGYRHHEKCALCATPRHVVKDSRNRMVKGSARNGTTPKFEAVRLAFEPDQAGRLLAVLNWEAELEDLRVQIPDAVVRPFRRAS